MDKKVRFNGDCNQLALRVYGVTYDCVEDSQAAGIVRLARGGVRFDLINFLTKVLMGS